MINWNLLARKQSFHNSGHYVLKFSARTDENFRKPRRQTHSRCNATALYCSSLLIRSVGIICVLLFQIINIILNVTWFYVFHALLFWLLSTYSVSVYRVTATTDYTQTHRHSLGRIPLDEWSPRRRDLYLTTNNTPKRQTSMPRRDSNPQSHRASYLRPTPWTARPLRSAWFSSNTSIRCYILKVIQFFFN